jgi:hypothetical protein
MQKKELEKITCSDDLKSVLVVSRGDHYNVMVEDKNSDVSVIRTARGGKREFKTLDAVKSMLDEVQVKTFTVC